VYQPLRSTFGGAFAPLGGRPAKLAKAAKLGDTMLNADGSIAVASPLSDFVSFLDVVSTTQPVETAIPTLAPAVLADTPGGDPGADSGSDGAAAGSAPGSSPGNGDE